MTAAADNRRTQVRRRRAFALAVGTALLLAAIYFVLESRGGVDRPADWFTNTHGVDREHETIQSRAVGKPLSVDVLVPPDSGDKPALLVFLHGRGTAEDKLSNSPMMEALTKAGGNAPVVVLPYGDEASYWHNRSTGDWEEYVVDEVIPMAVEKYGVDGNRVAIGGISMGGYGAYSIAAKNPGRFCAVGGHSPAIWQTPGETAEGAFDNAEDFNANDVIAAASNGYGSSKLWIDAGDEDPFLPGDRALASVLNTAGADLTFKTWPGEHDESYWSEHYDDYFRFYRRALKDC